MIKGYLFDYGATLDTAGQHWGQLLWHTFERHNLPIQEQTFRDAYVYGERYLSNYPIIKPTDTFYRTLQVKLRLEMEYLCSRDWEITEDEFQRIHDDIVDEVYAHVKSITAHSADVLAELHKKYKMVLVSNFYSNIRSVLKEFKLDEYFSDFVVSAEVGIRKPDFRIWKLGVDKLKMQPSEVVAVGDSYYKDVLPAMKAGCHAVWFKGEGWTKKVFDESVPDKVITDLDQLLKFNI